MFILHGLFGSSDNWQTIGKKFAEYFQVFLIDLRNHGRSFHSEEWNYISMANDLDEIIQKEGLDKVSILGHSMGGKTALNFAAMYPEKCSRLTIVDIGPNYYPIHHHEVLEALNSVDFTKQVSRKEVEKLLRKKIADEGTIQFLLKNLYWKEGQEGEEKKLSWRFNLKVITKKIDIVGEALEIHERNKKEFSEIPVLFIKGEKSGYIRESDKTSIKELFKKPAIIEIPGAGHWVHAEKPAELYNAVMGFLEKEIF